MNTEIRDLNVDELDLVSGGMDPNYKECPMGTKAGGGPGVYPLYVDCSNGAVNDLIEAKGRPAGEGQGWPSAVALIE